MCYCVLRKNHITMEHYNECIEDGLGKEIMENGNIKCVVFEYKLNSGGIIHYEYNCIKKSWRIKKHDKWEDMYLGNPFCDKVPDSILNIIRTICNV